MESQRHIFKAPFSFYNSKDGSVAQPGLEHCPLKAYFLFKKKVSLKIKEKIGVRQASRVQIPPDPYFEEDPYSGTRVANPGNLGRYQNQEFGTFLEIDIDEKLFVHPRKAYKIKSDKIKEKDISDR